jgi:hypothetical protein
MRNVKYFLLIGAFAFISACGYIKPKVFTWHRSVPATNSIVIDSTYQLYIRSICRDAERSKLMINGVSVFRNECHLVDTPNVLIERQYLYYSPVHRISIFIMLLPNYPRGNNGLPMFDLPTIRNAPVVNLWNANCILFGKMNEGNNQISFKHWNNLLYDTWDVHVDPNGDFVDVLAVTERKKGHAPVTMHVAAELAVNVVYRRVDPVYSMNVDGTMFKKQAGKKCTLEQRLFYEETGGHGYCLTIPYVSCGIPIDRNKGIAFKGKKNSRSRLSYDVGPFFY